MLKIIIRKRYLFVCMAIAIGAMIYCTTATSQATTILSDQEMAKITGKNCGCRITATYSSCRKTGVPSRLVGCDNCSGTAWDYTDVYVSDCDMNNPTPNTQGCLHGSILCRTLKTKVNGPVLDEHMCMPNGYSCIAESTASCQQCAWGASIAPDMVDHNTCEDKL